MALTEEQKTALRDARMSQQEPWARTSQRLMSLATRFERGQIDVLEYSREFKRLIAQQAGEIQAKCAEGMPVVSRSARRGGVVRTVVGLLVGAAVAITLLVLLGRSAATAGVVAFALGCLVGDRLDG